MYPNLRAEMARKNINLVALAKMIGMAQTTMYDKFNGRSVFDLDEADAIKDALGVNMSIDDLFAKDDVVG